MKKLIIIIILLCCRMAFPQSNPEETKFFGLEKGPLLHGTTTMLMSICINQWNKRFGKIEEDYGLLSIGLPIIFLSINEFEDYKYGNKKDFYKDMCYGIIGAITGKILCYTF